MLPREVIRQVRRLQLRARRAVEDLLGGEYRSVFKGTGIAFEEVREYQPGDDVRAIDWNVTARMGHPFIKRFIEERELTVLLLVDCSGSQHFGTFYQQKREVAAELAALLAFSAISNNDKVGLVMVAIADPREEELPAAGLVELEDAETGGRLLVDTSSRAVRAAFAAAARKRRDELRQMAGAARIDLIEVSTDGAHLDALVRL